MEWSRREFLGTALAATATLTAEKTWAAARKLRRPDDDDITTMSAAALSENIRSRRLSSEEAVEACLRRIEAVNPRLNAVVQLNDAALDQARQSDKLLGAGKNSGPLHGVPITIKDSLDTAGIVSTAGTQGRAAFIPDTDATVVSRLKNAGAIVIGKTNTPELTLSLETDNRVYGRTHNPYDTNRSPGGSSGGAAAAIAAGLSPLDIGSDTGASVRYPAHCCGIAGLKPTHGRVPRTGHIISFAGVTESLTTLGPLARYVEDLALVLPIIAGPDWRDPYIVSAPLGDPREVKLAGLRVASFDAVRKVAASHATVKAVESANAVLRDAGMQVKRNTPPPIGKAVEMYLALFSGDGGAGLAGFAKSLGTNEPSAPLATVLAIMKNRAVSTADYQGLIFGLDFWRSEMLSFMQQYDALICPVAAHPAPRALDKWETVDDVLPPWLFEFTAPFNMTGWPVAVVRAGTSPEGLPIGVQIVTQPWREDVALAIAAHLEDALGGWVPPAI